MWRHLREGGCLELRDLVNCIGTHGRGGSIRDRRDLARRQTREGRGLSLRMAYTTK